MKKSIAVTLSLFIILFASAQDPVHWSYSAKKIADKTYEVHITATIDEGWHIYSQTQPEDAIAQPTKIEFNKNPLVTLSGKIKETGKKELFNNKEIGISAWQYSGKVDFVQKLTVKAKVKTNLTGSLTFQVCTDEMCLPPKTISFSLSLSQ